MSSPDPDARSVVTLDQLTHADQARVGSKAANLGELRRAGFPVPDGVVIASDSELDAGAITDVLGQGPLAVRSSTAAEDLGEASFAGQYETVLDVRGPDALRQAIQTVRASATNARIERYRSSRGQTSDGEWRCLSSACSPPRQPVSRSPPTR